MSNKNWTPAQAAAIADRGGSLLVSAAAGSGKTAVLAERAVRLICDPVRPVDADRLLIVTFTNAAAAELRGRIGETLLAELRAHPGDARLQRQRMLLQRADICTIDAFCLKLLQQHFQALDVPPDFAVGNEGTLETLRQAALAETLENAYADEGFRAFADLYGKGRSDGAAGQLVLFAYDFLRSMPHYQKRLELPYPWYAGDEAETLAGYRALLLADAARLARDAQRLWQSAGMLLAEDWAAEKAAAKPAALAKLNAAFGEAAQRLADAAELAGTAAALAEAGAWDGLYALLAPWREGEPGLKGMKARLKGENKAALRAQNDLAAESFAKLLPLVGCSLDEMAADRAQEAAHLTALFAAVRAFDDCYYRKKLEKKVLEFSDFEHLALRLLCGPDGQRTALGRAVSAGFDAVMVDEYQDTNALQDALYRLLARETGDNLFFVGDLKQSIYRFRQAEPEIFREKLERFDPLPVPDTARPRPAEGRPGQDAQLALDRNFRSAPAVVESVNYLFETLMTPTLGGVTYGAGQRLVCGAAGDYRGAAELHLLQAEEHEQEAAFVARRIEELVRQGTPVRCADGTRPLRYEDCCILLATRTRFRLYADALAARGIPVYADSAEDLLSAPHIRPLAALLRVIDNPAQDIYLAAAMLGPMFGFTDDDLVRLRASCGRISLYGAVLRLAEEPGPDGAPDGDAPPAATGAAAQTAPVQPDPFRERVCGFYRTLTHLRQAARTIPVEELLEEIFVSTGYLAALGAMENGARRREDARRFAAFCCANGAGGVAGLIRAIDATEAAGGWNESAPGRGKPGCVTIMTIHRSKGLQFPAVFLADGGHHFNTDDLRRPLQLHRTAGAALQLRGGGGEGGLYPTAGCTALRRLQQQEMLSEQMRLLYVALTRAQDILVMTAPFKKAPEAAAKTAVSLAAGVVHALHAGANSFADWLLAAALRHPNGGELRRLAGVALPWIDTASPLTVAYADLTGEAGVEPPAEPAAPPAPDPALVERLCAGFAWQYPDAALAEVPAKVSVTSVVHRKSAVTLERPAFMSAEGLSAAEMGTALHGFLQHADFAPFAAVRGGGRAALEAAVAAETRRQVAAQLLRPDLADKLDTARLLNFFESETFGRVCAADEVLREYAFITALPAAAVLAAQGGEAPPRQAVEGAQVLVQGIADLLLVYPDHLELLDYKSDRRKTADQLAAEYAPQLNLYAVALDKRFAPKRVTRKGIYSLALGRWVEV